MKLTCGECGPDTIIESNDQAMALWAEMLANELKLCHIICMFTENPRAYSLQETDFYEFKLKRQELYVNSLSNFKSLYHLRGGGDENSYHTFHPLCSNVVDDVECGLAEELKTNTSKKICSIGRLDKPYIIPLAETIKQYTERHKNTEFTVIFVGDSQNRGRIRQIKKIFRSSNCKLLLPGSMYPISRSLIHEVDIFISSSGSAYVTAAEGKTTIRIPYDNEEPCFVSINEGTYTLHRNSCGQLIDLIETALSEEYDLTNHEELLVDRNDMLIDEFNVMRKATLHNKKIYFDIGSIKPHGFKRRILQVVGQICSYKPLLWMVMNFSHKQTI